MTVNCAATVTVPNATSRPAADQRPSQEAKEGRASAGYLQLVLEDVAELEEQHYAVVAVLVIAVASIEPPVIDDPDVDVGLVRVVGDSGGRSPSQSMH